MTVDPGDLTRGDAPRERPHLRIVVAIWAVLSVVGVVGVVLVVPLILPASESATEASDFDNRTIVVFTALAVPVALFVWVFLAYSLAVFRVKGRPTSDGPRLLASPAVQIGWLGVTGVLCLVLVVWGLVGLYQENVPASAASDTLVVEATGQQWMWTFHYPQYGVSSSSLELPVGRPVEFKVTSLDVLHGFAVQALGVRLDANPGEVVTEPVVTPTHTGTYSVRCVELCGLYHSAMNTTVEVVSADRFKSWVISQGGHS